MATNSYTDAAGVYKNKLGITDASELKAAEYSLSLFHSNEILTGKALLGVNGYGFERQAAIHKHLFQDVYEWAGKIRTVPSSKRAENGVLSVFANPDAIVKDWQELQNKTSEFVSSKGLSFEQKRAALADIFIDANKIHAFPEGNGRSLQVFMKELAKEQGVELDYTKVNPSKWNIASAVSGMHGELFEKMYLIPSQPNPEPIRKIFEEMASPVREKEVSFSKTEKNQAQLYTAAKSSQTQNMATLREQKEFATTPLASLTKIAFWRGVLQEQNKNEPAEKQTESLATFDKKMADPKIAANLPDPFADSRAQSAEPVKKLAKDDELSL